MCVLCSPSGGGRSVGVLHLRVHRHLLSEDAPQHEGAGHREQDHPPATQRDGPLDAGQDEDGGPRSLLLRGERLQCVAQQYSSISLIEALCLQCHVCTRKATPQHRDAATSILCKIVLKFKPLTSEGHAFPGGLGYGGVGQSARCIWRGQLAEARINRVCWT
ncbi:hypothetical protein CEXT_592801 [Caerostris extrusa]|uniref:Uncharacterized protein n=1 Tax=Caerostris extrusa TaxID=172846 RepID=A0AAV4UN60_CAEEX|nr:hypothetical protein CEXT_592801 [Caerostris extrusa]